MTQSGSGGEVVLLVLSWLLTTGLTYLVVVVDERRLATEKLERAWPVPSRDAAIVAFGVIALPLHFIRTRGNTKSARGLLGYLLGLLLGAVAFGIVIVVASLVLEGIALVLGIPTD